MELEARLQELERRRIDDDSRLHAEREKMAERVQQAQEAREVAEKEAIALKFVTALLLFFFSWKWMFYTVVLFF